MKLAILKIGGAVVAAALLGGVLLATVRSSRERALMAYCRNNAREIGQAGTNEAFNGAPFEDHAVGHKFWHEIRVLVYRIDSWKGEPDPDDEGPMHCRKFPCPSAKHRHEWKPILGQAHPFLCPVFGRTKFDPNDPRAIDYRGPRTLPKKNGRFMLGADRVGNHPDGGGHVIFVDGSAKELKSLVEYAGEGSSVWRQASEALAD